MELRPIGNENIQGMPDLMPGTVHYANGLGYIEIQKCASTSIQEETRRLGFKTKVFTERPDLYLVTVVRHPFQRLASAIVQYASWTNTPTVSVTLRVVEWLESGTFGYVGHWSEPQVWKLMWPIDVVIPIEHIHVLGVVFRMYGFELNLPHLQQSRADLKEYVLGALAPHEDQIIDIYREDYELWARNT